jgi:uncharacterized membrane protein YvbJ
MTLIKCIECGKQISDQAKHCVHCGYELQRPILVQQTIQQQKNELTKEQQDTRSNTIILLSINAIITIIAFLFLLYNVHQDLAGKLGALYTIPLGLSIFPVILPIANLITPNYIKTFFKISILIVIITLSYIFIVGFILIQESNTYSIEQNKKINEMTKEFTCESSYNGYYSNGCCYYKDYYGKVRTYCD